MGTPAEPDDIRPAGGCSSAALTEKELPTQPSCRFVPFGTGSVDGSDRRITPGLQGLTTALTLLDKAEITYQPR